MMTTMKKQILTAIASLALLSGYAGKNEAIATPAAASNPKVATAQDLVTGEKVYKRTCTTCHKLGSSGAPRMDSRQDWEPRLAQGIEVLYDHAVNGYKGEKGFMPARGANIKLSVSDVKAAVDYMVSQAKSN